MTQATAPVSSSSRALAWMEAVWLIPHLPASRAPLQRKTPRRRPAPQAVGLEAGEAHERTDDGHALGRPVISVVVVTFTDVASEDEHAVGAMIEGAQEQ